MEDLKIREKNFKDYLLTFEKVYGKKCIEEFFDYWTETNRFGSKMKYEMEKTWDTARRLKRWQQNQNKWQPKNTNPAHLTYPDGKFIFDKL